MSIPSLVWKNRWFMSANRWASLRSLEPRSKATNTMRRIAAKGCRRPDFLRGSGIVSSKLLSGMMWFPSRRLRLHNVPSCRRIVCGVEFDIEKAFFVFVDARQYGAFLLWVQDEVTSG